MGNPLRFEGLTLTVADVERSLAFYEGKLGMQCEVRAPPNFAMVRLGEGTIGLLSLEVARKEGAEETTAAQKRAIHVELTTDTLDAVYEDLKAKGVVFETPPHDEPWERSATAFDPDGYLVELAQGRRGKK